jgi:hypothetical protein
MIDVWPGGKYLNFVQNIIPKNAEIIKVEGLRDSKIEEKYGYKVVSGWVEVEHQSTYEYSVSYKTFSIYDKPVDKKIYNHLVQKQSGIGNAYIDINITYPEDWKINRSTSSLTQSVNDIEVSYLGLLNNDVEIELIFNK